MSNVEAEQQRSVATVSSKPSRRKKATADGEQLTGGDDPGD